MKRPSHGTVVAYVALILAVTGTGYAATQSGGARPTRRRRSAAVKVQCTAKQGRRKVACQVVGGGASNGQNGTNGKDGKDGKRGEIGPPGPARPAGPTTITQQPGYLVRSVTTSPSEPKEIFVADGKYTDSTGNGTTQGFEFLGASGGPAYSSTALLQTPLLSPGTISGSAQQLSSVSFCHVQGPNSPVNTQQVGIAHAYVYAFNEPDAPGAALPAYSTPKLIDAPLSIGNEDGGCTTVSSPSPVAIPPTAYLVLRLEVTYSQTAVPTAGGFIQFGRVSTTYTP